MIGRVILQRLLLVIPTLFISSVIIFFAINLVPGKAASAFLGAYQTKSATEAFNHRYGLDRPLIVQYVSWLTHAAQGDFGKSLLSEVPVGHTVISRIPVTTELALLAIIVAIIMGAVFGILAALRHGRPTDTGLTVLGVAGMSVPNFVVATFLILIFAIGLQWVPPGGYVPFTTNPIENLRLMAMPALALGLASSTILFRIMRASMIEILQTDYIRSAAAKGVPHRLVIIRHALKNAMVPFITVAGIEFTAVFGGAVIIEQIFLIPGLGSYIFQAVTNRDYFALEAAALVMTTMVVLVNALVDIAVLIIDPRRASASS